MGSREKKAIASFRLFTKAVRNQASPKRYERLYENLRAKEHTGFLDPLIRRVSSSRLPRDGVHEIALRLATRSPDRIPVKVGIALLGLCATDADRDVLLTLGRHEEFTHYVGVTLTNAFRDPEPSLWELAKSVTLWGRIALVRQLATTRRPEIKGWILREASGGWPPVRDQLAYIAATTGELAKELQADEIDDDLLLAAGEILSSLIDNRRLRSLEDIDDYEQAPEAIWRFLLHVSRKKERLETFQPIAAIVDYLDEVDGGEGAPHARWDEEERRRSSTLGRRILQRPGWRQVVDDGLGSTKPWTFQRAEWAARRLGDDTMPVLLDRLRGDHRDETAWDLAATLVDDARIDALLELGCDKLLLRETHPGPALGMRPIPGWLRIIAQELRRFPGKGWPLAKLALQSPNAEERRGGMRVLYQWDSDSAWPPDAGPVLEVLARSDQEDDLREGAADLLATSHSGQANRESPPT